MFKYLFNLIFGLYREVDTPERYMWNQFLISYLPYIERVQDGVSASTGIKLKNRYNYDLQCVELYSPKHEVFLFVFAYGEEDHIQEFVFKSESDLGEDLKDEIWSIPFPKRKIMLFFELLGQEGKIPSEVYRDKYTGRHADEFELIRKTVSIEMELDLKIRFNSELDCIEMYSGKDDVHLWFRAEGSYCATNHFIISSPEPLDFKLKNLITLVLPKNDRIKVTFEVLEKQQAC